MKDTDKKREKARYDVDYAKKNIKRVPLDMQKDDYDKLQAAASAAGEKVNTYIKRAIFERMEREQAQAGGGFGISAACPEKNICSRSM